jgi:ribose 5-phosphate isomerase B
MKIALASDHRGYARKEAVKAVLKSLGEEPEDFGAFSEDSTDYPEFAFRAVESVSRGRSDRAILSCHTGIGMSIAANKVRGIRAALCYDEECVRLSRAHNDANVLVLPATIDFGQELPWMVELWLNTPFEAGRHKRRLDRISEYESRT